MTTTNVPPKLASAEEVAAMVGHGYDGPKIRRLYREGKMPGIRAVRLGRDLLFPVDEVVEYLRGRPLTDPRAKIPEEMKS